METLKIFFFFLMANWNWDWGCISCIWMQFSTIL